MAAPMDFNVPFCEKSLLGEKIKMTHRLGYEGVAINVFMPDLTKKKVKKKQQQDVEIMPPDKVKFSDEELKSLLGPTRKPFQQYTRISTLLSDPTQNHVIHSDAVQKYDLVAVQPTNEKTFHQACLQMNVDIITIDVSAKLDFRIKRSTVFAAMNRGVVFELQYSHAIRNATLRQYFISNAQYFVFWGKGRNVILTSGCEKVMELRGPYDVANLGLMLNLNDTQSKDSVTKTCRAVLYHAESRRLNKSVSKVEKIEDVPKENAWLLTKTNIDTVSESEDDGEDALEDKIDNGIAQLHADDSSDEASSDNEESCPPRKKLKQT